MTTPRRYSEEQIERANRVDIVEYSRSQGLELKRAGKSYRVTNYSGGFYITPEKNSWNWFNEDRGGGVVQLCMELENKTWTEAIRTLLDEDMEPIRHTREWKSEPEPPKEFVLPDVNNTYKHMIAYLTKTRGIEPSVLKAMIDRKYIYENTHLSCVFVGRDKEGNARHASVRSTNTTGKVFKQDVPGSEKAYSFNVPGDSGIVNVFEAPIDLLSYVSLQKALGKQTRDSYLALGGTSDRALERFLQDYPDIKKIRVCTDNDKPMNELEWNTNLSNTRNILIPKNKVVKGHETDFQILFRTCDDYSRYIERNPQADTYYVSLSKDKLRFTDNGNLYALNVTADDQYTLYKSVKDFENGKGFAVSGKELLHHFYEHPAGEKAVVKIHEKYGNDYKVVRHRPTNKDFNEDLIAYRQNIREQEKQAANSRDKQQEKSNIERTTTTQSEPSNYFIKGSCEVLIICDSPKEVDAYREIQIRMMQSMGVNDYKPDEYYLAYRNVEQVQSVLQNNPQISKVWLRASRTAEGECITSEVLEAIPNAKAELRSKRNSYAEDLEQMNVIDRAISQTPIEDMQNEAIAGAEIC